MRNEIEKFNHTISVLVTAYLNGTLKHGSCAHCAVGNIVHAAGAPMPVGNDIQPGCCSSWKYIFYTNEFRIQRKFSGDKVQIADAVKTCKKTGYTVDELAKIEYAFETASPVGDRMFNGLMAVVDVLADIHGIDLSVREETKKLFIKS